MADPRVASTPSLDDRLEKLTIMLDRLMREPLSGHEGSAFYDWRDLAREYAVYVADLALLAVESPSLADRPRGEGCYACGHRVVVGWTIETLPLCRVCWEKVKGLVERLAPLADTGQTLLELRKEISQRLRERAEGHLHLSDGHPSGMVALQHVSAGHAFIEAAEIVDAALAASAPSE